MRTGLAAVGVGVGFHALFRAIDPVWVPKSIASAVIALGIFIFVAAERRADRVECKFDAHQVSSFGVTNLRIIAWLMSVASIGLIVAVWMLV